MATICFYQDSRHDEDLYWIREVLGIGYVSIRNDAMTELRINGFTAVIDVLQDLQPFIRFKKLQAEALLAACHILASDIRLLSNQQLQVVLEMILIIQGNNYKAHRKKSREELVKILGLTP